MNKHISIISAFFCFVFVWFGFSALATPAFYMNPIKFSTDKSRYQCTWCKNCLSVQLYFLYFSCTQDTFNTPEVIRGALSPTNQNQDGTELTISTLSTKALSLTLVVTDNPVIYDYLPKLKGYYNQFDINATPFQPFTSAFYSK